MNMRITVEVDDKTLDKVCEVSSKYGYPPDKIFNEGALLRCNEIEKMNEEGN